MAIRDLSLYFVIEDAKSKHSILRFYLPTTALDVAFQALTELGGHISALIMGSIVNQGVNIETDDDLSQSIDADADVQEKALFSFRTAENNPMEITIPTFDEQYFVAGSEEVDETEANVLALVAAMVSGNPHADPDPLPATPGVVDSRGEDVDTFVRGYEEWGKRRK